MLLMIEKHHRRPWGFEQGRYPIESPLIPGI